jgi:hypothetical protein
MPHSIDIMSQKMCAINWLIALFNMPEETKDEPKA